MKRLADLGIKRQYSERAMKVSELELFVARIIAEYKAQRLEGLVPHTDAVRSTIAAAKLWPVQVTGRVPES